MLSDGHPVLTNGWHQLQSKRPEGIAYISRLLTNYPVNTIPVEVERLCRYVRVMLCLFSISQRLSIFG